VIKITNNFQHARINKVLMQVPQEFRTSIWNKAIPDAAKIAVEAAQATCPRSRVTGTHDRKLQSYFRVWGHRALWQLITWKKVRPTSWLTYALVGPERPEGNKINFISEDASKTRKVKLWGNDPVNMPSSVRKDNDFMERAMQHSRRQQEHAFVRSLIKSVKSRLRSMARKEAKNA
jgi:hypothetical protein